MTLSFGLLALNGRATHVVCRLLSRLDRTRRLGGPTSAHGPEAEFVLGRLRCRRRSHLAPSAFGTETFSSLNDLLPWGFARCEAFMNPLSPSDVFLTVTIMSVTFLTEVGFFILIGML